MIDEQRLALHTDEAHSWIEFDGGTWAPVYSDGSVGAEIAATDLEQLLVNDAEIIPLPPRGGDDVHDPGPDGSAGGCAGVAELTGCWETDPTADA